MAKNQNRLVAIGIKAHDRTKKAFAAVEKRFQKIKDFAKKGVKIAVKFGLAGLAAGAAGIVGLVAKYASQGDALDKMSQRLGLSVKFLDQLGHAANRAGTDIKAAEKSILRMSKSVIDSTHGSVEAQWAWGALGVALHDANGELRGTEDLFVDALASLDKMEEGPRKTAVAMAIFGKSGAALKPLSSGLKETMGLAEKLGGVWDNLTAGAAATLLDTFTDIAYWASNVGAKFATTLMPHINSVLEKVRAWAIANKDLIHGKVAEWAEGIGTQISNLPGYLETAWNWVKKLYNQFTNLDAVQSFISTMRNAADTLWNDWLPKGLTFAQKFAGYMGEVIREALDRVMDTLAEIGSTKAGRAIGLGALYEQRQREYRIQADRTITMLRGGGGSRLEAGARQSTIAQLMDVSTRVGGEDGDVGFRHARAEIERARQLMAQSRNRESGVGAAVADTLRQQTERTVREVKRVGQASLREQDRAFGLAIQ